jgi:hypothetical protein
MLYAARQNIQRGAPVLGRSNVQTSLLHLEIRYARGRAHW